MPHLRPLPVALALSVLAAAQAVAVVRAPVPLEAVDLQSTKENYGFLTTGREMTVTFQLRNGGDRTVRVERLGAALPGLALADVAASGEPFAFRSRGLGEEALPAFELAPDGLVVVSLTYRLTACNDVPADARPVPVAVQDGRARGVRQVALPQLPDDGEGAGDEDLLEWQQVLVRELCG